MPRGACSLGLVPSLISIFAAGGGADGNAGRVVDAERGPNLVGTFGQ